MARSTSVQALLGADTFEKVKNTKILVVGAGGIGCELRESSTWLTRGTDELVKNLVLVGFANIEIVNLSPLALKE
jgi:ubiquitin-like 1-activating enzyme E1 B